MKMFHYWFFTPIFRVLFYILHQLLDWYAFTFITSILIEITRLLISITIFFIIFFKYLRFIILPKENMLRLLLSFETSICYKDCFASNEFSLLVSIDRSSLYLTFYLAPISSPQNAHNFEATFELSNHFLLFLPTPDNYFSFLSFIISIYFCYLLGFLSLSISSALLFIWFDLILFLIQIIFYLFIHFYDILNKFSLHYTYFHIDLPLLFSFNSQGVYSMTTINTLCPVSLLFSADVSSALGCLK